MKSKLRKEFLSKRDMLRDDEIKEKSNKIIKKILESNLYSNADWIFTFINMGSEVITKDLITRAWQDSKNVAVPIAKKNREMYFVEIASLDNLTRTKFGVYEPDMEKDKQVFPSENTLFIVPGSVFDIKKNRSGYGGGYYDTYIRENNVKNKVGVAYDFQLLDKIPVDEFDMVLDEIITDNRHIV